MPHQSVSVLVYKHCRRLLNLCAWILPVDLSRPVPRGVDHWSLVFARASHHAARLPCRRRFLFKKQVLGDGVVIR